MTTKHNLAAGGSGYAGDGARVIQLSAEPLSIAGESPAPKFVAIGSRVMQGNIQRAVACSKTFAKRIANALNKHVPNREGV